MKGAKVSGMNRNALQILGRLARHGEMPLDESIRMSHKRGGDHVLVRA